MSIDALTGQPTGEPSFVERIGAGHILLIAIVLVYPIVASDFFLTQIGGYSLVLGMVALSLMLLAGYGGMVSLAQITVAGVAGYTVAILGENNSNVHGFGWPWWLVAPMAIVIAAFVSALIGWIAVRTEGIYTIMITLAVATAAFYFTQQNYGLFNGFPGYSGLRAPIAFGVNWRDPLPFYFMCLFFAALAYCAVLYASRSTFGLTLQAIRDNPRRMRALGYDVTAHKVFAWFLAGLIAGTAGVLLVWFNGRISPGHHRRRCCNQHSHHRNHWRHTASGRTFHRFGRGHADADLRHRHSRGGALQYAHRPRVSGDRACVAGRNSRVMGEVQKTVDPG